MLYLSKENIHQAVSRGELLDGIEQALCLQEVGGFTMPQRIHLDSGDNTLLLMPCLTESFYGTKLVTVFPENAKQNLPSVAAIMMLNSADTGEILAILDGQTLTALRTGAVGGVGIRHTCPQNTERLGIVGTGVQGFNQALFAASARPLKEIQVLSRNEKNVAILVKKLTVELPEIRIRAAASIESLLESSQVVITATNSPDPVLPNNEELLNGRHFIGIGSYKPTMREFPEALFRLANHIYVDTEYATEESGDLVIPLSEGWISHEQVRPLGQFLMGKRSETDFSGETTIFKSVGMALLDVCIAGLIYEKALEQGLGKKL